MARRQVERSGDFTHRLESALSGDLNYGAPPVSRMALPFTPAGHVDTSDGATG
jgi:hypothetical protein